MRIYAVIFVCLLCSCMPYIKSAEEVTLNEYEQYYVGRSSCARTLQSLVLYLDDPELTSYVTDIGYTMALNSNRPHLFAGYNFAIVKDKSVNAFCFSGGFVFITTAALQQAQSEDEIAAILAHEIAHANFLHPEIVAENAYRKEQNKQEALWGGKLFLRGYEYKRGKKVFSEEELSFWTGIFSGVVDTCIETSLNGFGKQQELDADQMAMDLLNRAGYNPFALRNFLSRLSGPTERSIAGWISPSYPSISERIALIESEITKNNYAPKDESPRKTRFLDHVKNLKGIKYN